MSLCGSAAISDALLQRWVIGLGRLEPLRTVSNGPARSAVPGGCGSGLSSGRCECGFVLFGGETEQLSAWREWQWSRWRCFWLKQDDAAKAAMSALDVSRQNPAAVPPDFVLFWRFQP